VENLPRYRETKSRFYNNITIGTVTFWNLNDTDIYIHTVTGNPLIIRRTTPAASQHFADLAENITVYYRID
jgi:hypothetical protein